jgi:hypothetical protein
MSVPWAISSGCDEAGPCASTGCFDWEETSFFGAGDGWTFERFEDVHMTKANVAAAAPAATHSKARHAVTCRRHRWFRKAESNAGSKSAGA